MKLKKIIILTSSLLLAPLILAEPEAAPESTANQGEAETGQVFVPPPGGIYKTVDEHGNPIFTDRPLEYDNPEKIGELDSSAPLNAVKLQISGEQAEKNVLKNAEERKERQKNAAEQWAARDRQLKQQFENAKKAHASGQETKEGDFIGYRNKQGGQACCRPSPQRLERLKRLEDNLKKSQMDLKRHRKLNPKTYRAQ